MKITKSITDSFASSIDIKNKVMHDADLISIIEEVTHKCITAYQNGNKILFCGNGGSAADAQHIAAELSGRFYIDREPLFAEALHVNSSFLTATANDYDFSEIYARMVRAMGKEGDILFALSTSGNSKNIIRAAEDATKLNMTVVAMTGQAGGKLKNLCDFLINIPSIDTPRIQELHMLIGHVICEQVEAAIFK